MTLVGGCNHQRQDYDGKPLPCATPGCSAGIEGRTLLRRR
jgi:hypothetical protein